jgi:hypothetical protein
VVVRPQLRGWLLATVASLCAGCAGTLDTITSQRFRENPFRAMFHSDDPMYVLRNVPEADDRAKAMQKIKEPSRSGRPAGEQDELIQILSSSATADRQAVCRFGAIEALTRFDDPRAAQILVTAYHNAAVEAPADQPKPAPGDEVIQASRRTLPAFGQLSSFTPEQVGTIQIAALDGLGKKRSSEGLTLLCEVASAPVKKEVKTTEIDVLTSGGSSAQDRFDLRLAAIRSLGNYKGEPQATAVLYKIMTTERGSVATKNRAHKSLVEVTGKKLPPDSPEWAAVLGTNPAPAAAQASPPRKQ